MIDTRRAGGAGPYVEVAPVASSIEERLDAIQRRHPDLGPVATILSIPWLKSIAALREMGVFERITARLVAVGAPEEQRKPRAPRRSAISWLRSARRRWR